MACALTAGNSLNDCKDSKGGSAELLLIEKKNITGYTVGAGGVITAITLVSPNKFWKYQFKKETLTAMSTENVSDENDSVFYDQKIEGPVNKMTAVKRNEFKLLAMATLVGIVKDNNGNYMLYGKEYGLTKSQTAETGKGFGDFNGYKLSFVGKETEDAYFVDATIIAGITN